MPDYPFLKDIADKSKRQKDIANGYADLIISSTMAQIDIDWKAINEAILSRWKLSGLARIKKMAWDMVATKIDFTPRR